ncbi:unnamed protein product [Brassicogethes aeneus]|uniref:Uncharacterized protein n=1 Tax=Brassicogethes aeneus TaxID=1431903 RepID=A0A9P0B4D7_BRAAE|nr:unnamed protein product [Brassicogethes aeneus]
MSQNSTHLFYKSFFNIVVCAGGEDNKKELCCPAKAPMIIPLDKCTAKKNKCPQPPEVATYPDIPRMPNCANCDDLQCLPEEPVCSVPDEIPYCDATCSQLPCIPIQKAPDTKCPPKKEKCEKPCEDVKKKDKCGTQRKGFSLFGR